MSIVNVEALKQNGCQLWWPGNVSSANSPKQITSYGDCKQILPFPGAGIGMFDGNGDRLACGITSDWSFLAGGTWTVECWFYVSSYGKFTFISTYDQNGYTTLIYRCDNTGKIVYGFCDSTGGWWNLNNWYGSGTYLLNAWNHVAMVRNGNDSNSTIQCFLNGVLDKTFDIRTTLLKTPTSPLAIGSYWSEDPTYFNGYMSEIRVSNIARYTTNFTPPRCQLESDANTKLLLHFNRNDTTFIDSSPSAHTITRYGDAKQLCSPCNSGVAYFDGTGDYLTCGTVADWSYLHKSNAKYSINFSFMCTSLTNSDFNVILDTASSSNNSGILVGIVGATGTIRFAIAKAVSQNYYIICESTATIVENTWYNVVITYDDTLAADNAKLYVNGTLWKTATKSGTPSSSDCYAAINIGRYASNEQYFKGYISEVRVINSVVSPLSPTQPFTPDPYTKLLLHFDGVGNAFYDSSDPPGDNGFPILPDGVTITPNGTFTTQKMKDGRNIWKFNGSNNYITFGANNNLTYFGTNDFTLCAWVYSSVFNSATMRIFGISDYFAANVWWAFGVGYNVGWGSNAINIAVMTGYSTYADIVAANVLTNNTWNHVVFVVRNGSPEMYCNGSRCTITKNTVSANWSYNAVSSLYIGNSRSNVSELMDGCIKDAMIFKKALTQDQIAAIMAETYIY